MKRLIESALLVAASFAAVSCVVEIQRMSDEGNVVPMEFTAHSDVEAETRTALDEEFRILWKSTDHITVFDGNTSGKRFSDVTVSNDSRTAVFKGEVALANTYYAIYPAQDDAIYSSDDETVTAVLPTEQTGIADTFADGMNLSIAKTEGSDLYFRNVGALLAVKSPTGYAGSIKIISKDPGAKMSGKAMIDYNDGNPTAAPASDAADYVQMTLGNEKKAGDIYYFVAYPGDYSGFDIVFTSASLPYLKSIYSSTKELKLNRNDNVMLFDPEGLTFGWNSVAGPTSISVSPDWMTATVSWTWNYTIPGGQDDPRAGYKVYVRKTGTAGILKTVEVNDKSTMSAQVTGLEIDTAYDFGVQTLKTSGKPSEIVWKNNVWLNGNKCIPPTPVSIEQINETQVTVTWMDNTGAEKNYMFWKKENGGGEQIVNTATLDANVTTYTTGVVAGHTYEFGIQALHKESAENNSGVIYFDPFVALTWEDLLDVDMGANECLKPEQVAVSVDGQQATISWECYSSVATGFNVFIREDGQKWSKSFMAEKGKDDRSHKFYKQLEYGKTYYLGVQSVNSVSMSRNSDIVEKEVRIIEPTTELFDWEKSRTGVPTWSDMTLCYGGDLWRVPTYWDKERFASHALYTDEEGKMHYLFDAFLALEFSMKGYTLNYDDSGNKSGRKEEWTSLINYWFDNTYGFQALDDCLDEAAQKIGDPETKRLVIFVLPDPVYCETFTDKSSSTTYWGKYEDGTTADFSTIAGRTKAYKWMIDQVRAKFASKDYKHIELGGFYVLQETLSDYNKQYKEWKSVLSDVAEYCHGYKEGFYWIPYGYQSNDSKHNAALKAWKDYGFDVTVLQPGEYWDYNDSRSWDTTCSSYINQYGMGMELEFEGTHGEDLTNGGSSILYYRTDGSVNNAGERNKNNLRSYFQAAKDYDIYGKKPIVLYSGSDAMNELANSKAEEDIEIYRELCEFILDAKH